jgi:hypothetical protein
MEKSSLNLKICQYVGLTLAACHMKNLKNLSKIRLPTQGGE